MVVLSWKIRVQPSIILSRKKESGEEKGQITPARRVKLICSSITFLSRGQNKDYHSWSVAHRWLMWAALGWICELLRVSETPRKCSKSCAWRFRSSTMNHFMLWAEPGRRSCVVLAPRPPSKKVNGFPPPRGARGFSVWSLHLPTMSVSLRVIWLPTDRRRGWMGVGAGVSSLWWAADMTRLHLLSHNAAALHRLPVKQRMDSEVVLIVFKARNGAAPSYVSDITELSDTLLLFGIPQLSNLRSATTGSAFRRFPFSKASVLMSVCALCFLPVFLFCVKLRYVPYKLIWMKSVEFGTSEQMFEWKDG